MITKRGIIIFGLLVNGAAAFAEEKSPTVRSIALPGGPPAAMDYLAYDRAHKRVWAPAGNTGSVDVIDVEGDRVHRLEGFPTASVTWNGRARVVGPSSASVGDGVVYVGNRADSQVCAIDAVSLKKGACVKLPTPPDGVVWVAATREVWVTTPRDKSLTILSTPDLKIAARITVEGEPEGYAVDDARGLFYTNLEDKDRTLTIELKSRRVTKNWAAGCGSDGPRGLALDGERNFLFVACGAGGARVLDPAHDGALLSTVNSGAGVDNIDYVPKLRTLYVAAARAGALTAARIEAKGAAGPSVTTPTVQGARNAVATDEGTAYVADSQGGRLLVVPAR